jgi:hypothetical protein
MIFQQDNLRGNSQNLRLDVNMILKCGSWRNNLWGCVQQLPGSCQGPVEGSVEHGDKLPCSMKGKETLHRLTDYYLLKKDFACMLN